MISAIGASASLSVAAPANSDRPAADWFSADTMAESRSGALAATRSICCKLPEAVAESSAAQVARLSCTALQCGLRGGRRQGRVGGGGLVGLEQAQAPSPRPPAP